MESLNKLLELWRENKDIEQIISSEIFLDSAQIQAFLNQGEINTELLEMAQALQEFINKNENILNDIKNQLDNNKNITKACLSYTSAGTLGNKNKRDE